MTITGDSDCDILEEEYEIISLNDIVWFKVNKAIWQDKVTQILFIDRKEDSEFLKTKWMHTRKEENILVNNVSLDYSKNEYLEIPFSTIMERTWRKLYTISPP